LARQPLWRAVQAHPSGVVFPGGESMRDMAARAVSAVRDWDARLEDEHGADAMWVAVTHGDLIKAVLADALAMHLDSFQRIVADPGSVSVVSYRPLRPFVVRLNEHGDLSGLRPARRRRRARRAASDAVVGGGAGGAVP
ncbi:MAG TPA: histidine phosphatase family protein, partial [Nocardioidaceae bacterium]|nr:histidine phosphatase family protein [Nocardioidaceae bacterium]